MNIIFRKVKVKELIDGYVDNDDEGVWGYGGKLNIRPKYQREFVYGEKDEQAVIDTVFKGFPLNVMYWVKNGDDFEVLDGQQRTISLCHFGAQNRFNVMINGNRKAFANLTADEREKFLNYELMIYVCEGEDSEKIDWFRIINKQGVKLEQQELLNAVYAGPWLTDAKRHFSKNLCPAYQISKDYQKVKVVRQELLELALKWISNGNDVEKYMSVHQHDEDANELWTYFQNVIRWIEITFPVKRSKIMKLVNWGELYNNFHNNSYNSNQLEDQISQLIKDRDVTNLAGIYHYVLSGDETKLHIRQFDDEEKFAAYERQKGICIKCGQHFEFDEMEGDHIIPWSKGGKTNADNCQMLCKKCNGIKSNK